MAGSVSQVVERSGGKMHRRNKGGQMQILIPTCEEQVEAFLDSQQTPRSVYVYP